nr:MAG TPA: hypothetical protein [Caudoviricetes sp.]
MTSTVHTNPFLNLKCLKAQISIKHFKLTR